MRKLNGVAHAMIAYSLRSEFSHESDNSSITTPMAERHCPYHNSMRKAKIYSASETLERNRMNEYPLGKHNTIKVHPKGFQLKSSCSVATVSFLPEDT